MQDVDPSELKKWLDAGEVLLIDVREKLECDEERIPGGQLFPTSTFDPQKIPKPEGKRVVFYCAGGVRSARAAGRWEQWSGSDKAFNLRGGIVQWKKAGYSTTRNEQVTADLWQRACLISGIAITVGTLLAMTISAWFLVVDVIAAAGLVVIGLTGSTWLAIVLSRFTKE